MFLTTKGRYTIMAILDMHEEAKQTKIVSIKNMSERQGLSVYYLEQLFSMLKKAGIVKSTKGPGGGYEFAKPTSQIKLREVLEAVGENFQITKCALEEKPSCHKFSSSKCNSHELWNNMTSYLLTYLNSTTIEDIANKNFFFK
jgi:Rrf2 family iron-sulfur cluster assembly transcriptional regulator